MEEEHTSSMVNKDVQDRSLFLFAPFLSGPHCAAFFEVQLKQQRDDQVKGGGRVTRETPVLKPLLKLFDGPEQSYLCTAARIFSHSKVYVLLEDGHRPRPLEAETITNTNTSRAGYAFGLKTRSFDKFASPKSIKPLGTLLSAHGQLYYIASPWGFPWISEASFERYDPAHDKWDTLPSFPYYSYRLDRTYKLVMLFVTAGFCFRCWTCVPRQSNSLAIMTRKMNGIQAVVVGETLYAVALSHNLCVWFIWVAVIFCHVQTGQSLYLADIQHIGVTTFEIVDDGEEGNPMINTLHSTVYAVDTSDLDIFDIDFGLAT
ncbi:unnamed protein product [Malus baccata var. baccata]